jgi:glycosyltransferase involved in cell wall biosynthesis
LNIVSLQNETIKHHYPQLQLKAIGAMKIVYVIASLETSGGTERIISEKANYLADVFGYDISIICYGQSISSTNFYNLSKKINQICFGLQPYLQYQYKYLKRIWEKYIFRSRIKKMLSSTVNKINPDILIGITHFRADFVCAIDSKAKIVIESHIPRTFIEKTYDNNNLLINFYKKLYDLRYFNIIEKRADIIITLTEGDHKKWTKAKQLLTIPNFSNIHVHNIYDYRNKRVITIGRLFKEKGFDRLLDIWKSINDKHPDWQLDIYGDGVLKENLEYKIKSERILNATLRGITNNISKELSNSSICVAASYFEGFSLALLEAIKHGVPCIAFDCPYGPKTIIEDGKNGFLIEDGNISLYVEELCTLIECEQLRQQFSKAAIEKSKLFDTANIMSQWKELFEDLVSE